jgi:hypothetical protein
MIAPSFLDSMRVDCTPGFEANLERFSRTCAGCGELLDNLPFQCPGFL